MDQIMDHLWVTLYILELSFFLSIIYDNIVYYLFLIREYINI